MSDPDGFLRWELEYDGNLNEQIPSISFNPLINPTTLTYNPTNHLTTPDQIFYTTCDIKLRAVDGGGTKAEVVFHLRPIREFFLSDLPSGTLQMAFGVPRSFRVRKKYKKIMFFKYFRVFFLNNVFPLFFINPNFNKKIKD